MQAGIGGKIGGAMRSSYERNTGWLNQLFPVPHVSRSANPFIAAALELLGLVGFMGLGRMYAGDLPGGARTFVVWLITYWGMNIVIWGSAVLAVIGALFTLGISLLVWIVFALPLLLPLYVIPIRAAVKLFAELKRSNR